MAMSLHLMAMRGPIGTTRRGQLLLGAAGLIVGIGGSVGLEAAPRIFEPLLRLALYGLGALLRMHAHYDPSERTFFAALLAILGASWTLLMGYAFVREPARNRAIDAYLQRKGEIDKAHRATIISQDDRPT